MCGAAVRAAFIPFCSHFQLGHKEGLCAKAWCHTLQSRDVLAHNLLGAQTPLVHALLERTHKLFKHPPNADFRYDIVVGDVFGKSLWDAGFKAETKITSE